MNIESLKIVRRTMIESGWAVSGNPDRRDAYEAVNAIVQAGLSADEKQKLLDACNGIEQLAAFIKKNLS